MTVADDQSRWTTCAACGAARRKPRQRRPSSEPTVAEDAVHQEAGHRCLDCATVQEWDAASAAIRDPQPAPQRRAERFYREPTDPADPVSDSAAREEAERRFWWGDYSDEQRDMFVEGARWGAERGWDEGVAIACHRLGVQGARWDNPYRAESPRG
jgi:hypothetical protein